MATKPKTFESPSPVKDAALESMLAKALEQFNAGKLKEAAAAFSALQEESIKLEVFHLGRTAQGYLKAIQTRLDSEVAAAPQAVDFSAQLELNNHRPEAALTLLEEGLKAQPENAGLLYLKALALAQLDQPQPSADALVAATALDAGLIYQFRLDADFDGVRHAASFAVFNRS